MDILVCVKDVPDRDAQLRVNSAGTWIDAVTDRLYVLNRYDEFALEEALRIKERRPGTTVDVVSVGPERRRAAVRRAMAMGADNGVHLRREFTGYENAADTARCIAAYCRSRSYDLILTGVISEDQMQGLTGPMIAACMGFPCATAVLQSRLAPDGRHLTVDCELEGGEIEQVAVVPPAVLTIQSSAHRPRYPSLSNMMRARRQELLTVELDRSDDGGGPLAAIAVFEPQTVAVAEMLTGTPDDKAAALLDLLIKQDVLLT